MGGREWDCVGGRGGGVRAGTGTGTGAGTGTHGTAQAALVHDPELYQRGPECTASGDTRDIHCIWMRFHAQCNVKPRPPRRSWVAAWRRRGTGRRALSRSSSRTGWGPFDEARGFARVAQRSAGGAGPSNTALHYIIGVHAHVCGRRVAARRKRSLCGAGAHSFSIRNL